VLHPFRTFGRLDQKIFHRLTGNLRCYGIEYHEADYGPGMGGCIAKAKGSPIVRDGGKRYRMPYTMIVNRKHCWEEKFATIAHELGHLFCGHLGNPLMDLWPDRSSCDLQVREFEAESGLYVSAPASIPLRKNTSVDTCMNMMRFPGLVLKACSGRRDG